VHLYCSYCDEILTGSIAGPGGKISDHLITIRHVYQQAILLNAVLENGTPHQQDIALTKDYVSKLEEWSDTIRYRVECAIKRIHFEEVLERLHARLEQLAVPSHSVRCVTISHHFIVVPTPPPRPTLLLVPPVLCITSLSYQPSSSAHPPHPTLLLNPPV
jgi:hypothetical protein